MTAAEQFASWASGWSLCAVLLSNITGCAPDEMRRDMVSVTWEDLPDGRRLPLFRPAGG